MLQTESSVLGISEENGNLKKDIKFFRVAIWHIYGIHTYISLTLKHLYVKLYSGSDFGPEVCKKC